MPKLIIDGKEIEVAPGTMVIEAVRQMGGDVPHFCYHPKLSISGNCRMCLVEVEKMPKPQISCNLPCTEGMVVHTQSENAKKWRKNVLEFILVNHPIDCPVCDQAGECKLQNYYLSESVKGSQFNEEKVHKPKRVALGPNVVLDDERCIMCSRCIRFCDEITKTSELGFIQRGDHVELRPFPGKQLDNAYSINTVDICPVGALTSEDFRFKKRVWFLKSANSICTGCSTGCNIKLQSDNGVVYRYLPRDNEAVNQCWICDEGRLSYKEINEHKRVLSAQRKRDGKFEILTSPQAVSEIAAALQKIGMDEMLIVGSAQASNENNFALKKFAEKIAPKSKLLYAHKEVANPSQDNFLIKADKNPNTRGAVHLGYGELREVKAPEVVFILGELSEVQRKKVFAEKPELVVVFATHMHATAEEADYVLPMTMFAEEEGSFTNFQGRVQKFEKALEARSQMQSAWKWLNEISKKLGHDLKISSAEQLLKEGFGLSYSDLGDEGKVL